MDSNPVIAFRSVRTLAAMAGLTGLAALGVRAQAPWPQDTKNPGMNVEAIPLQPYHMTMGLNFLADGRMVWATAGVKGGGEIPAANANSAVWIVSGLTGDMSGVSAKKVADQMRQPAGVTIVDNQVYVSDRDAFYKIINYENPSNTASNRTKVVNWPTPDAGFSWTQGEQWHQWVATPVYHNGKFYGPYGGSIQIGGRSATPPTSSWSGAFISWNPDGGGMTKIAGGMRVPNGMTMTPTGQFFVTDNQGSWLPSCTFNIIKPNKFMGHRQTAPNKPNWAEDLPYEPPTMWLVDGVHQSASQPLHLTKGPYAGDFIVGDDNSPGLSRISLDNAGNGNYNGAMFFFTGGFSNNAINRLAMHSKEEAIIVGTFLAMGDWPDGSVKPLYRITFKPNADVMEMRSIHSRKGGVEIVFSKPVNPATAVPASFTFSQWHVARSATYGCCEDEKSNPSAASVQVSKDNMRVFLAMPGATAATDRVLRINAPGIRSATGGALFHNTAYFTHNFQGTAEFNPEQSTALGPRDVSVQFMDRAVEHSVGAGALSVRVDLEGDYTVSLHDLRGARLDAKAGRDAETHVFRSSAAPSLKVLRVTKAGHVVSRPVVF